MSRAHVASLAGLLLVVGTGCNWHSCDDESVEFELAAPGDAVEIVVEACVEDQGGAQLFVTLRAEPDSSLPLSVRVDGVGISAGAGGWGGGDGSSELVGPEDCDPGRRVSFARLDADPAVRISGSLRVKMNAPPGGTCSAAITVTPTPRSGD